MKFFTIFFFIIAFLFGNMTLKKLEITLSEKSNFDIETMSSLSWNEIEPLNEPQPLFLSNEQKNKNHDLNFRMVSQNRTSNSSNNTATQNDSNHSQQNISSNSLFENYSNKSNETKTNHSKNISNSLEIKKNESSLLSNKNYSNKTYANNSNNNISNKSENYSKNASIQNQTSNNSDFALKNNTNFSEHSIIRNISQKLQEKNETHSPNNKSNLSMLTKNENLSHITDNNTEKNFQKLKNEFENITNILNKQNNLANSSKDLLDALNYTNLSAKNASKTKKSHYHLKKSKKFSSLRSFIKSSLIVDNLNERNLIKSSLSEKSNLKILLKMLENYNNCSLYSSCDSCVQDIGCGWCPTLNLCIIGDREGPYLGKCPLYQYGFCKGQSCMRYTDCFVLILYFYIFF